jgi:4-diphosphocytidyl-2-C-methyl-D-erythritol kinase
MLPAFAKINWMLRVRGRRPDGYHEIETVFQTVALHDSLYFSRRGDEFISLTCDRVGIPIDRSNLIVRAAMLLKERLGIAWGADIHLEKRIPAPGGLGGGSADAASALLGLCRLWNLGVEREVLAEMGRELGADVPFFFTGGTALGTGTGEKIRPLPDARSSFLVIVTPDVAIATAAAYQSLNAAPLTKNFTESTLTVSPLREEFGHFPHSGMRNDFESVVATSYPPVARAKELLLENGADLAMVCGSGASVYGLFSDRPAQERAAAQLRAGSDGSVFVTETLSRTAYATAMGLH